MDIRGMSLILIASLASPAFANSAYYYGGVCGNQGNWTQQALARTNELRTFITQVKDDPNCKVLPQTLQETYSAIEARVQEMQSRGNEEEQSNLPREIGALRAFMGSDAQFRQQVAELMTGKMVRQSVNQNQSPLVSSIADNVQQVASDLGSLKDRTKKAFAQSLTLLDRTVDTLPLVEQCLVDPNQFGHFLASTIQLIGSFASSSQDATGSQLARTVSKLVTYSREKKFAMALRTLDQNQFLASLSCLLEVTSESYCAARDGKIIFDEMMANSELEQTSSGELKLRARKVDYKSTGGSHPLEGYYILTQNMPIITQWLQTIQIGVEPRLPTDSAQKNKPLDEINNFFKTVNDLKGYFNSSLETLREMQTLQEKRNLVLKMTVQLSNQMTGSGFVPNSTDQNFFTMAYQPMHIPFRLLGIETPPEVMGTTGSGIMQSPAGYLEANYERMAIFSTPEILAQTISTNMQTLIRNAESSAITYYNKWFVIDKIAIVNRSIVGVLYNVKESLKEVDAYLERLEKRVRRYSDDQSMIPGVRDTRARIQKVLTQFRRLETAGRNAGSLNVNDEQTLAVAEELIKEVYEQFYVMLAKSGWLANRMVDFVQYDYNLMQRSGLNMTPYIQEIYLATGRSLVDNIISMSSGNPSAVNQDLSLALRLNKGNLESLETALGRSYVDQIAFISHVVEGYRAVNGGTMWHMKNQDRHSWKTDEIPGYNNNSVWRYLKAFWKNGLASFGDVKSLWTQGAETFGWLRATRLSPDDEFGSARRVKNQLCVQTLAFNDLGPYWYMCRDSVLESPYVKSVHFGVTEENAKSLNVSYKEKAWEQYKENKSLNHSKRICGLRDYNRKNLVLYLLQGQTRR